jgi:hypothetical protein
MFERIDAASLPAEDFVRRYGIPARPVILRGLFRDQAIAQLSTRQDVIERLGSQRLHRVEQQSDQIRKALRVFFDGRSIGRDAYDGDEDRSESIRNYLGDEVLKSGDDRAGGPRRTYQLHGPTPAALRALFRVPAYCDRALFPWCTEAGGAPASPNRMQLTFVAGRGHVADLHSHPDLHHIFLHQMFGRKKVVLFPPSAAGKLSPVLHVSSVALNTLSSAELASFVAYGDGEIDVLEPGETLFLPATWWHYMEYLDDAMSINMRFAEPDDADLQFLLRAGPDCRLTRVAFELRHPELLDRYRSEVRDLRRIAKADEVGADRYANFIAGVEDLYRRLSPGESRTNFDWNELPLRQFNRKCVLPD